MIYKTHMELELKERTPDSINPSNDLRLIKLEHPSYGKYRDLHNKVGAPYGWDQRPRINDVSGVSKLLTKQGVELWEFYNVSVLIGYALFTCEEDKTAELEDFGFFPEFSGNGHGSYFLSKILDRLAEIGIERVWLTTRSTNHQKVISFYQRMGFQITGQEPIDER